MTGMTRQTQNQTANELVASRFMESIILPERFFRQEAEQIARACRDVAQRLQQGGRLIAVGSCDWLEDVTCSSAALVQPWLLPQRTPPVLALVMSGAPANGQACRDNTNLFTQQLRVVAQAHDIALGFTGAGADNDDDVLAALAAARDMKLLTMGLCGDGGYLSSADLDYCFVAPGDPSAVREIHGMLYHVLCEVATFSLNGSGP